MRDAAVKAGVKHQTAFNYRFVPAVRQAYELIRSGKLGKLYHFRAFYLQEWIMPHYNTPMIWRTDKKRAGSGALGDLGSHVLDLARFLMGEVKSVSGMTKTFISERPLPDGKMAKVDVDDAFVAVMEFANGGIGTLEASRFAAGHKNHGSFEINGEKGSIRFNLEKLNELEVFWVGEEPTRDPGLPRDQRDRGIPPVHLQLVAAGPHHRVGAHLRSPVPPLPGLHRQQEGRRPLRRDLRGRLPQQRHLDAISESAAAQEADRREVLREDDGAGPCPHRTR